MLSLRTENKISKPVCIEYIISQYLENKEKGILNEVERRKQEITMKMYVQSSFFSEIFSFFNSVYFIFFLGRQKRG